MTLIDLLDQAGLTGRGGAAFKTAIKVHATRANGARLIVNACDGEIGASKDAHVVAHHLDELVRGATLVSRKGARYAAHRGSATAQALHAAGLDVLEVPDRYVSSEESSLVSAAAGAPARPLTKRVPIAFGAALPDGTALPATVVLNAETVWRIAQIDAFGVDWFRSFGTAQEPGPRLVSITGAVRAPGVVAAMAGMPLTAVLDAAGGPAGALGAVGVSGLSGGWLTAGEAASVRWANHDLRPFGLSTGASVLNVIGARECPLATIRSWLTYAAGESAGQCGPCMFGVPAAVADVVAIIDGRADRKSAIRLRERAALLSGRGACHFPDGVGAFIRSTLRAFPEHLADHARGTCMAGTCHAAQHQARTGRRPHVAAAR
jgi:NADH:ubiquinone oxidoreductase subunit F (NADH-binding)